MSAVASKNLYELLGNNHDEDSDKEPEPPVKVVDKTPARTTKRNAPAEAPASKAPAPTAGRRGGGFGGNEGAFRDRNAGSANNRGKPIDDGARQDRPPRAQGTYEGRGRGRGGNNRNFDRHSRTVGGESEKQAGHGWGANEGGAELADEQAGEAIASAEQKETLTGEGEAAPVDATEAAEAEPEDNSISYADYLAQQAERKLSLGAPEPRKPNEGSKQDKKWANAKPISKDEEEDFVAASGGKAKRERERKQKQLLEIDQRFVEAPERGRGGFRGGRGRGDGAGRQGRGEGFRGGRGEHRGEHRGPPRGGRGGDGPHRGHPGHQGPRAPPAGKSSINTEDTSAFPSLGS